MYERSHYLPLFSRLGTYDSAILDDLLLTPHTETTHVEYWAHVAAFIPVESWSLWAWKMRAARERNANPGGWLADHRKLADSLLHRLRTEGPATFSQLEDNRGRARGSWWDWSDVKTALEYMFDDGIVTAKGRVNFQRIYAPVEDVIPADVLAHEIPEGDARRTLAFNAIRAMGVGTPAEVADYYRTKLAPTRSAIIELVEAGLVEPVRVKDWDKAAGKPLEAFAVVGHEIPARAPQVSTILTPFDPVTWNRDRALRMFGFDYKIEIYTPAPKRVYGYYSLPVVMNDALVARIDLKADRKNKTLIVKSAHWEARKPADAIDRLVQVVRDAAAWRGLENITVDEWGDAASDLRKVFV